MANPFGSAKNPVQPHVMPPAVEEKPVEAEAAAPVKKKAKKSALSDLVEKRPDAKNYTVYLDMDLIEEIDRFAKESKTNRSKIINKVLRNAIFGE